MLMVFLSIDFTLEGSRSNAEQYWLIKRERLPPIQIYRAFIVLPSDLSGPSDLSQCFPQLEKMVYATRAPISLETPIGQEGDAHLGDLIEDHAGISPAEAVMSANVQERTAHVLRTLSPREETIIRMRFGMEDGSERTLEEVGRAFSVTRERIRQIEAKALRKLRHPSRSQKLKSFFDDYVNQRAESGPQTVGRPQS
jgi:RNA polymerase sigma factor (sigma-70 family)